MTLSRGVVRSNSPLYDSLFLMVDKPQRRQLIDESQFVPARKLGATKVYLSIVTRVCRLIWHDGIVPIRSIISILDLWRNIKCHIFFYKLFSYSSLV
jgi:hypothetical protein